RVSPLMEQHTKVVGRGAIPLGGGGAQVRLSALKVAAPQHLGAERARRGSVFGALGAKDATGLVLPSAALPGPIETVTPGLVPHKLHRRTTRNLRTPGIPQLVRSLRRFVDFP